MRHTDLIEKQLHDSWEHLWNFFSLPLNHWYRFRGVVTHADAIVLFLSAEEA
jgi:hypothetical protein